MLEAAEAREAARCSVSCLAMLSVIVLTIDWPNEAMTSRRLAVPSIIMLYSASETELLKLLSVSVATRRPSPKSLVLFSFSYFFSPPFRPLAKVPSSFSRVISIR